MKTVIYVDVLFLINFFMTVLILLVTSAFSQQRIKTWRLLIGGLIGGVYALVILVDRLPFVLSAGGKVVSAAAIVLAVFSWQGIKQYLKNVLVFFISSMVLLGIIIALWFIFEPPGVVIRNESVYFDVSTGVLLFSGIAAYGIACLAVRIYQHAVSKKQLYVLSVRCGEKSAQLTALSDTGNKLREPFSGKPVIIAEKSRVFLLSRGRPLRIVPFDTIGGRGLMECFQPESVTVVSRGKSFEIHDVYIALSDMDFSKKPFNAIFNPVILRD